MTTSNASTGWMRKAIDQKRAKPIGEQQVQPPDIDDVELPSKPGPGDLGGGHANTAPPKDLLRKLIDDARGR